MCLRLCVCAARGADIGEREERNKRRRWFSIIGGGPSIGTGSRMVVCVRLKVPESSEEKTGELQS